MILGDYGSGLGHLGSAKKVGQMPVSSEAHENASVASKKDPDLGDTPTHA